MKLQLFLLGKFRKWVKWPMIWAGQIMLWVDDHECTRGWASILKVTPISSHFLFSLTNYYTLTLGLGETICTGGEGEH